MIERTQNIKRNLIFNVIKFVTQMLLQFILRTIMIYVLGSEYLGLNGLFSNIFTFLNLAELGIGSAIVFSMYKPIADGDIDKVKALQNLYKKFYFIISLVILGLGLLILPFIRFLIKGDVTVDVNIYVLYVLYLTNTLIGYFSAHKRSLLFAYQRNDVENKIKTIVLFGMSFLQIIVLILTKNYYMFFIVNIIFSFLECVLIHIISNKLFPEINGKSVELDKETKKEIGKNVAALSFHKIGGAVVFSTDNILISSMFGLVVLGAYSNYYLIITTITSVFTLISNSLTSSVGNLIASSSKEYVYEKYKQINIIFSVLTAFATVCMIVLFQSFINIWTGGGVFLLDISTVILMAISFYLSKMRMGTMIFKECAGLFKQDQWKPIFESLINLIASIILGRFIGINGVILGTIISTILAPLWVEPLVLYKNYFNKNIWDYFKIYFRDLLVCAVSLCITILACIFLPTGGVWWFVLKAGICILVSLVSLFCMYLPSKDFREVLKMGKSWLKSLKKQK